MNHLLITVEMTDDMVKVNLAALTADFDCTGASLDQLYIRQNELQNFAIGTTGTIDDSLWVLQTTAVIENAGTMNKAVLKWQAQAAVEKTKAQFIIDFNKAHKDYLALLKLTTTTPVAHNVQETNDEIEALSSLMNEIRTVVNQVVEAQNSARDDASILSTRSNVLATVTTTQPMLALQQELAVTRTALTISEARHLSNNIPNPPRRGGGCSGGRGRPGSGGSLGGHGGRRPAGILGACSENDKRLTRYDNGRTTKTYGNQNYCHTYAWDNTPNRDSTNFSYPDKFHDITATAENTKNGCDLYKRVSHRA